MRVTQEEFESCLDQKINIDEQHEAGFAFTNDVKKLADFCLVSMTKDKGIYDMHSLVQSATRDWLNGDGQQDKWKHEFIFRMYKFFQRDWSDSTCTKTLLPHISAMVTQEPQDADMAGVSVLALSCAGGYAIARGLSSIAEYMLRPASSRSLQDAGEECVVTTHLQMRLVAALNSQGKSEEVAHFDHKTLARSALPIALQSRESYISFNLGTSLMRQGRFAEGEKCLRAALKLDEDSKGPNALTTLMTLSILAMAIVKQGISRYAEAENILRKAILGIEEIVGADSLDVARVSGRLGIILLCKQQLKEANGGGAETSTIIDESESYLSRVVLGYSKFVAPEMPEFLVCRVYLSIALARRFQYQLSCEQLRLALDGYDRTNVEPFNALVAVMILGTNLAIMGHGQEARRLYERASANVEVIMGDNTGVLSEIWNNFNDIMAKSNLKNS